MNPSNASLDIGLRQQCPERITGTCIICRREGLKINASGLVHRHGPRSNPCGGSHTRSVLILPTNPLSAPIDVIVDDSSPPTSINDGWPLSTITNKIPHPKIHSPILKRIPKGARPEISGLLHKLIQVCVQQPQDSGRWARLLGFASGCLVRPGRGGKGRNLTTQVIHQALTTA